MVPVIILILFFSPISTTASLFDDRMKTLQEEAKQQESDASSLDTQPTESSCKSTISEKSIIQNSSVVNLSSFPSRIEEGHSISVIDQSKNLFYVHSFVSQSEADSMRTFCGESGRFQRSPQTGIADKNGAENQARTSSSCPLLFAYFYMPRFEEVKAKSQKLAEELSLTWDVTQRAAKLMGVGEAHFEPFQLLKYSPGEFYKQHHDHRGYYDSETGYPDRPITMLLFLNDVNGGGELKFEKLGLEFKPRVGDAVVWSNIDQDGRADPEMVHEAMPPEDGIKMAVNIWVRDKAFTDMRQASMRQH